MNKEMVLKTTAIVVGDAVNFPADSIAVALVEATLCPPMYMNYGEGKFGSKVLERIVAKDFAEVAELLDPSSSMGRFDLLGGLDPDKGRFTATVYTAKTSFEAFWFRESGGLQLNLEVRTTDLNLLRRLGGRFKELSISGFTERKADGKVFNDQSITGADLLAILAGDDILSPS